MKMSRYIPLVLGMAALALPAAAQDYEDDIYYNPKAKKAAPAKKQSAGSYITGAGAAADYPAADTYTPAAGAGLQMSVDEYNRHTSGSTAADSSAMAAAGDADFAYTRRIERFHNPDIIAETGDDELAEYYYATEQPTVINVNVIDVDPWDWWGPSWNWRYNSWYSPYWRPYYGYGWNWGPSWSWGWGGGHHHHDHAWRPSSPGASRPHRPGSGSGMASTHRPGNNGYSSGATRPGNNGHATGVRPGSNGRPSYGVSTRPGTAIGNGTTTTGRGRFGNSGSGTRPGRVSGTATNSNRKITGTTRTDRSSGATRSTNATTRNSGYNNSRNSNSSRRSSYNSGSFGGGSRGSFGGHGGGGASRGGGGGSRGRR